MDIISPNILHTQLVLNGDKCRCVQCEMISSIIVDEKEVYIDAAWKDSIK